MSTTPETNALELAMRAILRLFADNRLVYRYRETRVDGDVERASKLVRSLRAERAP